MTLDNDFIKKFGDSLKRNVKLSNYSWFNLGGRAEFFYKAKNINELKLIKNIDGFLIGGASQDPKKFIDIIKKTYN